VAETLLDVRQEPKPRAYELVHAAFDQVMADTDDPVTAMATVSALLHHGFGFLWTGFYRVVSPELLRVGPYQGTLGCLEIPFGKGVCGTAATERRTVIVPDVHQFPGHITCDARSRSEIVVPVFGAAGELLAVLDIDSDRANTFDADDQAGLERLVSWFAGAHGRRNVRAPEAVTHRSLGAW
jgi:L-methionine (R)-S-oxide reductase